MRVGTNPPLKLLTTTQQEDQESQETTNNNNGSVIKWQSVENAGSFLVRDDYRNWGEPP